MSRKRLYVLIIYGCLLPLFFPTVRDILTGWRSSQPVATLVEGINTYAGAYTATYAPSISALIAEVRTGMPTLTISVNGKSTTVAGSTATGAVPTTADWNLKTTGATLTGDQAEAILKEYDSPAQGFGYAFVTGYKKTGIDPAYVMAQFIKESTAGRFGIAAHTLSSGNIRCTDGNCYQGFQVYNSWATGIEAHFDLLQAYAEGRGFKSHRTIDEAIATWSPPSENDTPAYIAEVHQMVSAWRQVRHQSAASPTKLVITGTGGKHPPTDDYRVNPNARFDTVDARYWGFQANNQHWGTDVLGTDGQAVYAPFDGTWIMSGTYPEGGATAGQYAMFMSDDDYEIYEGHLKNVVQRQSGARVKAGDKLGEIRGDLAHTHLQVRKNGRLMDFEKIYEAHE